MTEPAQAGDGSPRAYLRVGGALLAQHQLALALTMGCERIVCMVRGSGPELAGLQQQAERGGARLHPITTARALSGLVTVADELLVLGDGLLPTPGDALRLLKGGSVVLVQPAERGIPAGFERIDLNHAAAGAMLLPGRLVERLNELPEDADPASALLRIALQSGVAQRPVPDDILAGGRWLLLRDDAQAQAAELGWMARHTAGVAPTPGPLAARALVRQFGPALLHGGGSGVIAALIAGLLALIGLGCGWFGWLATGLLFCGGGWVLWNAAALLTRVQRDSLSIARGPGPLAQTVWSWGFDLLLIALLMMTFPRLAGQGWVERGFGPVMLLGMLRLMARGFPATGGVWAEDRLVLVVVLAAMVLGKVLVPGVSLLALAILLAGLFWPRGAYAFTRS